MSGDGIVQSVTPEAHASDRRLASSFRRSALTIAATIALFGLPYNISVNFLAPLMTLCLALATIWLLPRLGWAVIAMIVGITVAALFNWLTLLLSLFDEGLSNHVLDGAADWARLTAALVGAAYLVWLSIVSLSTTDQQVGNLENGRDT